MTVSLYSTAGVVLSSAIIYLFTHAVYDIFFHPLAKVPGPLLAKVSCLWKFNAATSLKFADRLRAAHAKYGPVSAHCLLDITTSSCLYILNVLQPFVVLHCHLDELRSSDIPTSGPVRVRKYSRTGTELFSVCRTVRHLSPSPP